MSAAAEDDDFGFDICSVSLSRADDRGPLEFISGERLARLQGIEAAAIAYVSKPTPDNYGLLVQVVRQKPPLEKS